MSNYFWNGPLVNGHKGKPSNYLEYSQDTMGFIWWKVETENYFLSGWIISPEYFERMENTINPDHKKFSLIVRIPNAGTGYSDKNKIGEFDNYEDALETLKDIFQIPARTEA